MDIWNGEQVERRQSISVWKVEGFVCLARSRPMKVLHVRPKRMKKAVIGTAALGLLSLGLLIGGGVTGNLILVGAGVALLLFVCAGVLGTRRPSSPSTSFI